MSLRYAELFAGYHGLGMGLQSVLGGSTAWFSEFDKAPSAILAHHWPDVPNHGDITKIDFTKVEPVDVLTGGFPCQDVSHAGRRAGLIRDGEGRTRSGLWGEMLRAITELRPRLVVAENVRGLLSAAADSDVEPCPWCLGDANGEPDMRALGAVLADLADVGYDAWWVGLRAADVGAAHGRFRVFIFAVPADSLGVTGRFAADLGGLQRPGSSDSGPDRPDLTLLPTPRTSDTNGAGAHGTGGPDLRTVVMVALCAGCNVREPWEHRCEGPTCVCGECSEERRLFDEKCPTCGCSIDLHDAGGFCAGPCGGNGFECHGRTGESRLLPTPTVNDAGNVGGESQFDRNSVPLSHALLPTPRATDGTKGGPNQRGSSGDLMLPSAVQLLPTPSVADVEGGRKHRSGARSDELLLNGIAHHQAWGDYAPAIARWEHVIGRPAPAPTEPGPKGNPRLSARFVEWMMGLPAGHVTDVDIPRNAQLKALGNGVVPQQAAAAARWFLTQIERTAA